MLGYIDADRLTHGVALLRRSQLIAAMGKLPSAVCPAGRVVVGRWRVQELFAAVSALRSETGLEQIREREKEPSLNSVRVHLTLSIGVPDRTGCPPCPLFLRTARVHAPLLPLPPFRTAAT